MTQTEYQQKRNELWYEYTAMLRRNCASRYVFDKIFDHAYALGKEQETITQEEIEKAAEKHADELKVSGSIPGALVPLLYGIAKSSYIYGAQNFLGKCQPDEAAPEESNYFQKVNSSHHSPDPAKMVDNIIQRGFRSHNRLHVAAMAMQGLLANPQTDKGFSKFTDYGGRCEKQDYIADKALRYADALIKLAEKNNG